MLPGAIVDGISHNFAIVSLSGVTKVVDSRAILVGTIVGHDCPEFTFWVLPTVLIGMART